MKRRDLLLSGTSALTALLLPRKAQAHRAVATYVHPSLAGGETACGGTWSNAGMIVASKTHRCGTRLRLTNPDNGARITVRVTDHSPNSALDLSREAFSHLAPLSQGTVTVDVSVL